MVLMVPQRGAAHLAIHLDLPCKPVTYE
jgi:hypothetical protein